MVCREQSMGHLRSLGKLSSQTKEPFARRDASHLASNERAEIARPVQDFHQREHGSAYVDAHCCRLEPPGNGVGTAARPPDDQDTYRSQPTTTSVPRSQACEPRLPPEPCDRSVTNQSPIPSASDDGQDTDYSDEESATSDAPYLRSATPTESILLLKETNVELPRQPVALLPRACRTQQESDRRDECKLRLGIDFRLSRWYSGSTLLFYFDFVSFGSKAHFVYESFLEAVKLWTQEPGIHLALRETRDEEEATFRVSFSSKCDPRDVALAFFPSDDEDDRTIYIHPRALADRYRAHLTSIFCHELGHVFGLRHEFSEYVEMPSVQFQAANSESIMIYPEGIHGLASWAVQEQDRQGLRAFMAFGGECLINKEGERFHRADYVPTPMGPGLFQRRRGGRSQGRHIRARQYFPRARLLGTSLRAFLRKLIS